MTTPGFTPVNDAKAVEFVQQLSLPTQLNLLVGSPDNWSDDNDVQNALVNLRGVAKESAERLGLITADLTVTSPVRHDNAFKVASRLVEAAEGTQRMLENRAKEYQTWSADAMATRFTPDPALEARYMRIADWVSREAKNSDNGYTNIREAIEDNPDFAVVMYNTDHRLLGLPADHATNFGERAVARWAPEALKYIERSVELDKLAKRYPAFIASVHASFYSKIELAKMQTRFVG